MARWLKGEEYEAWRLLVDAEASIRATLDDDLARKHGISLGEFGVLAFLSEADGNEMRMTDLAEKMHLSPSGLTRRLDRLVRQGIVERIPSAEDRRVILAVLTNEGKALLDQASPDHTTNVKSNIGQRLSPTQILQLCSLLHQLLPSDPLRSQR